MNIYKYSSLFRIISFVIFIALIITFCREGALDLTPIAYIKIHYSPSEQDEVVESINEYATMNQFKSTVLKSSSHNDFSKLIYIHYAREDYIQFSLKELSDRLTFRVSLYANKSNKEWRVYAIKLNDKLSKKWKTEIIFDSDEIFTGKVALIFYKFWIGL